MPTTKLVIRLEDGDSYDVRIGNGLLDGLGGYLERIEALDGISRLLIITDETVGPLYAKRLKSGIRKAGYHVSDLSIPAGESAKRPEVAAEIWEAMAAIGLDRKSAVIALGGGVVCDMAGFCAATYMRGIPCVLVPTSLLAMVDACVGGKTALNLEAGKNLVGTFSQPAFVCIDTDVLATLPERHLESGLGELAKTAVLYSDDFFFWTLENAPLLRALDGEILREAIVRSLVFKADVIARDVFDRKGVRACLNYGHTVGHALEKLGGFSRFTHGEAVAYGMRFAAELGEAIGTSPEFVETQGELLDEFGLPASALDYSSDEILEAIRMDKKREQGAIRMIIPHDVADWELIRIEDADAREALEDWLEELGA